MHGVIETVSHEWVREDNILKCQLVLANVGMTLLYEVRAPTIRRGVGINGRLNVAAVLSNGGSTY